MLRAVQANREGQAHDSRGIKDFENDLIMKMLLVITAVIISVAVISVVIIIGDYNHK